MNSFKFFQPNKVTVFVREITTEIRWTPASLMDTEKWTVSRSESVKHWLQDFYSKGCPMDHNEEYFADFDRVCEVMEWTSQDVRELDGLFFKPKIRIYKAYNEYMDIHLSYFIARN